MKFQVTGQNKNTGARMVLEFEAESKGAAERKALSQGMSVNRVEDITDGYVEKAHEPRSSRRKSGGKLVPLLVVIIILAAAYYFVWPKIAGMLHH